MPTLRLVPLLAAFAAAPTAAQVVSKVSVLPRQVIGAVTDFQVSPDGGRVVYRADSVTDELFELYSVPIDGAASPTLLSGTLVSGGDVAGGPGAVQISPDGSLVAYLADQLTDDVLELFVVPIDGSAGPVVRSAALVAGGDVASFAISADGSRIVYRADQDADDRIELYSVPIDGSEAPTKLNATLLPDGDVLDFVLGAAGTCVAYRVDQGFGNELWSVPIAASQPAQRLSAANHSVDLFRFTPDESRVVYRADQDLTDLIQLFSAPSDGSAAAVRLNATLVANGGVQAFEVASNGARVVYLADQDVNGVNELYSVPVAGSLPPTKLHPAGKAVVAFAIRPGAQDVLFASDLDTAGVDELYRVPIGGGTPVKLNPSVASTMDVTELALDPTDTRVLYKRVTTVTFMGGPIIGHVNDLFSVPISGGAATRLAGVSNNSSVNEPSFSMSVSPAGGYAVLDVDGQELLSVPIDGSEEPVRISYQTTFAFSPGDERIVFLESGYPADRLVSSAPLGENSVTLAEAAVYGGPLGQVEDFKVTPDGRDVLYRTLSGSYSRVFAVSARGHATPRLVSAPDAPLGESGVTSSSYCISPDSQRAAYAAPHWSTGAIHLFGVALRATRPRLELDSAHDVSLAYSVRPRFTPDSGSIVYASGSNGFTVNPLVGYLFVVPADGSATPRQLSDQLGLLNSASQDALQIASDGSRVVYALKGSGSSHFEIYSVPIDGSSPPVKLNASLAAGFSSDVGSNFAITPDGARVLYTAKQGISTSRELYSAPIDGSAPAFKLSGTIVSGGNVDGNSVAGFDRTVKISPDGARTVFLADKLVQGTTELFSVPTDGSGAPVKLNGTLVAGGDVSKFTITPDGTRVVYTADQASDEVIELYSVPIDGSASAVKRSGTLVTGGDVANFEIVGNRVVYAGDQATDGIFEVFSASLAGVEPAIRISGPLVAGGNLEVGNFLLGNPVRGSVYYVSDALTDNVFELFEAAIDGSLPAARISGPLVAGGDVSNGPLVTRAGLAVLYRADQELDGVNELYTYGPASQSPSPSPHATTSRSVTGPPIPWHP